MKILVLDGPASLPRKREHAEFSGVVILDEGACLSRDLLPETVLHALSASGNNRVVFVPESQPDCSDRANLVHVWGPAVEFLWLPADADPTPES